MIKTFNRKDNEQWKLVDYVGREIEKQLDQHQGDLSNITPHIRQLFTENLNGLEYFVLVKPDGYGVIHTNHLREGNYFNDPVGLACAGVTSTRRFLYPRNTGEKVIDISTPIYVCGEKKYVLRSGRILMGVSNQIKTYIPFVVLQLVGLTETVIHHSYWASLVLLVATVLIVYDFWRFTQFYHRIINFMKNLASGDLTVKLEPKSRDEIGQIQLELNKVSIGITSIIKQLKLSAEELKLSSSETATSMEETNASIYEIAHQMQEVMEQSNLGTQSMLEVSESLVSLSSLIQMSRNKANTASSISAETKRVANQGKDTVVQAIHSIELIEQTTSETEQKMEELQEYSKQIEEITLVISNIAEQTNLLALNASIESARAGEHGRGFAVVAEEVRRLAEQTRQESSRVGDILRNILTITNSSVEVTKESRKAVKTGSEMVGQSGVALEKILEAVTKTAGEVDSIVSITKDEVADSDKIVSLIDSVAGVVEKTSAYAQNTAASTEEMTVAMGTLAAGTWESNNQAMKFNDIVQNFKLD